ncbi:dehydrogenase [Microbacterium mangrovi]|uniref:Dehydrogenase n=1 Tax=Microbacterium mangrovi TaxID=1348253 RepID=A0A0B2A8G8_9MICO|nr:Gfo/Idh/MocA family oxidoreductase [Microbacterium mangrovi]KHK97807.1 dehydrogenase [Microbacterium mangrovi]
MSTTDIGVAVIGAGMAGKAHAAAYRSATTVYSASLPPVRLVSIADVYEPAAIQTAERFGYERHDTSWQAIVDADDIDVVSVVVANRLHREIVEALLAAGKHVLCEKPLSDTMGDAEAMVAAADRASTIARIGLTFRRSPGFALVNKLAKDGALGRIYNVDASYWTDYAADPAVPISWRFKGPAGSGALADVGSHLSYLAEFVADSEIVSVHGGTLNTVIPQRPKPAGAISGRGRVEVTDEFDTVENDDVATFSALLANGANATLQVSRVAAGHPNSLAVQVFGEKGAARFDFRHPSEVELFLHDDDPALAGWRTIVLGPDHPYWRGGLPMDAPGVGVGQNEGFVFQARAFLEEVAGIPESESLPRNADFADALRNMKLLDAAARSALTGGATVTIGD